MHTEFRLIWLTVAVLTAVIAGSAAGILSYLGGANPANAILRGGVAFGGTLTLAHLLGAV